MKSPCKGLWMQRTPAGIPVIQLRYTADPMMTPEVVAAMRRGYSSEAHWRKEMEGDAGALGGTVVYPEFDPELHMVPDTQIPRRGCRYMSIDPHPRTPHAFLWVLVDAWNDLYVYRELWPSIIYGVNRKLTDVEEENIYTIKDYAQTLAWLEGNSLEFRGEHTRNERAIYRYNESKGERIIYRLMDQASKGFLATGEAEQEESYSVRYARYGIHCRDPRKAHHAGEDAIRLALAPRKHDTKGQWPRLHIAESCEELRLEFQTHKYKATKTVTDERDLNQERVKARCHLLDDLRYLLTSPLAYIKNLAS